MIAVPSSSNRLSGPADSVTRVVIAVMVASPLASATRFGRSPMWYG